MMPTATMPMDRTHRRWAGRLRIVALMGLWLWGTVLAATVASKEFKPELRLSSYNPTKTRDPFGGTKTATTGSSQSAAASMFQLEGILYDAQNPVAVINGRMVSLRKPVQVPVGMSEVEVNAVEITRQKVVLEVNGQRVELRLSAGVESPAATGK